MAVKEQGSASPCASIDPNDVGAVFISSFDGDIGGMRFQFLMIRFPHVDFEVHILQGLGEELLDLEFITRHTGNGHQPLQEADDVFSFAFDVIEYFSFCSGCHVPNLVSVLTGRLQPRVASPRVEVRWPGTQSCVIPGS